MPEPSFVADYSPHRMLSTYEKEVDEVSRMSLEDLNKELDANSNGVSDKLAKSTRSSCC